MRKITTGDMMHVHGAFGAGVDYTVRTSVRLENDIDPAILKTALEKTQRRYPYLCVWLKKEKDAFYYEDNLLPVALIHGNDRITLNSAETNYHVWAVCYYNDWLYLDIFHGITDGAGMYNLLATLLYYYCSDKYGPADKAGIRTLEDIILPEEYEDPQDSMVPPEKPRFAPLSFEPAFTLETDGGLTPSDPVIWDVSVPEDAFIRFTSANDSSPGTMISLLFARAIDSLYPDRTKGIVSTYVVNSRPMLGAPLTHHNCLSMVIFRYSEKIKSLPFMTQCTVYRGTTFVQSDDDRIAESMALNAAGLQAAEGSAHTVEEKKEIFCQMFNAGEGLVTYLVSYIGKWKYPMPGEHMLELWSHPPNTFSLMAIVGAVHGRIFITVQQRFKEDTVVKAFLRQLEENDISYELKESVKSDISHFPEPELKVM